MSDDWIAGSAVEVYSWGACGIRDDIDKVGQASGVQDRRAGERGAEPRDVGIRKVKGLEGKRVVQASIGAAHVALLTDDGDVFSYGDGSSGQLGLGADVSHADDPTRVTKVLDSVSIVHVACGAKHTAAVTSSGSLITWYVRNSRCIAYRFRSPRITIVTFRITPAMAGYSKDQSMTPVDFSTSPHLRCERVQGCRRIRTARAAALSNTIVDERYGEKQSQRSGRD